MFWRKLDFLNKNAASISTTIISVCLISIFWYEIAFKLFVKYDYDFLGLAINTVMVLVFMNYFLTVLFVILRVLAPLSYIISFISIISILPLIGDGSFQFSNFGFWKSIIGIALPNASLSIYLGILDVIIIFMFVVAPHSIQVNET